MQLIFLGKLIQEEVVYMKFGDKLIKLRKTNGLSQEELAEKLNVSRQSVSKWESNNTYPETDKIVQICNLFDCSMDELINDKIGDIEKRETINKKKYQVVVDSFLDFIVKTINLFTTMSFIDVIKCLIELVIISIILLIGGILFVNASEFIINNLFSFLNNGAFHVLNSFIKGLSTLIWLIISIIVIIHIFTIRYLNYYDDYLKTKSKEEKKEDQKQLKEKRQIHFNDKKTKIIFRDDKTTPLAFLTVLSKIVLFILKVLGMLLIVFIIFVLFGLFVSLFLFISLAIYSDVFKGISIAIVGLVTLGCIIIYILGSFILKKKIIIKGIIIFFILAFLITATGTGISLLSLKDIDFVEENSYIDKEEYKKNLTYEERMFIDFYKYSNEVNYVIDNSLALDDIIVTCTYDSAFHNLYLAGSNYYNMSSFDIYTNQRTKIKEFYQHFINNLKNNIISNYSSLKIENFKITANEQTINKLLDNYAKVYFYDTIPTSDGYLLKIKNEKVQIDNYYCRINYDIYNDTMTVLENDCLCEKQNIQTTLGNKTIYRCYYDE